MTWETLPYDAAGPRLDPGGCPRAEIYALGAKKIAALYDERRTSRWDHRFEKAWGTDRRGDRLEAVVLVLVRMWYRCDLVTRNVYVDAPNSFRGVSLADLGRACKLTFDRVVEAIADIKSAGLEFYHWSSHNPGRPRRRHPSAQPRRQKDRRPDDPLIPGVPIYSDPAVRCLDLGLLGEMFQFPLAMSRARKKAGDERKLAPQHGPPKKHRRKRRRREHLPPRKRSTPGAGLEQLGLAGMTASAIVPQVMARAIGNREAWAGPDEPPPPPLPVFERPAAAVEIERDAIDAIKFEIRAEIKRRLGYRNVGPPPPELDDEATIEAEAHRRFKERGGCPF